MIERVLITGGAGFLGRHLAADLAGAGWDVTVLDDLSCSNSTFECEPLRHKNIQCIRGTIQDEALVTQLVADHPVVIHFASVVGVEETISRPLDTVANLIGTLHVARALTPAHTALFGSSADVYGLHSQLYDRPMREDDLVLFEDASVNRWVYPKVKALEENVFLQSPGVSIVIRIFNCYGFGMDYPVAKRVVPQFVDRLMNRAPLRVSGDGQQRRAFCYYEDTVRGLRLALEHGLSQRAGYQQTFNIGNPQTRSMAELAEMMIELALEVGLLDDPLPIEYHAALYSQPFTDSWHRVPDISRARALLGFEPTVELTDGMRRLLRAAAAQMARPVTETFQLA